MNKTIEYVIDKMKSKALTSADPDHVPAIESFCDYELPYILEVYGPDDIPAINEAFNDYTDMLCKNGEISEEIYNKITFDFE